MGTFLDATGLQALWNKIKTWVGNNYQPKGSYAASNHTHNYASTVKVGSAAYNVSGGTVSLPAYPSVPSLSGYVNTVNVTGSGNVITDISKSGSTITVTKGNVSGGSSGGSVSYVYKSTRSSNQEDPILQLEKGQSGDFYVEILRNAQGYSYCGGEIRLTAFQNSSEEYTHTLQICPLGIRNDGIQVFDFQSQNICLCIDNIQFETNSGEILNFNVAKAKQLGLLSLT